MEKAFSVIIPVYNAEKYLKKCVESLLKQSYADFEAILIDDGSQDESGKTCDDFAARDLRVKTIHKNNAGVVAARADGAREASGKYVVFLDSDDWLSENYLEEFARIAKEYSPDMMCCGSVWMNGKEGKNVPVNAPAGKYDAREIEEKIFPYLIEDKSGRYFSPSLWGKAFRRELIEKYLFTGENVTVGEDCACVKPCVFHSESLYISEKCLYYYRVDNLSSTRAARAFEWCGPKEIGKHFESTMDMGARDMQEQVYRCVTHYLFNVAVSRFCEGKSYKKTAAEIRENLKDTYYAEALKKCRYKKFTKGSFALLALKTKNVFLLKLFYGLRKKKK